MELQTIEITKLRPHPQNPRTHPDSAIEKLVRSLKEYGFTNPILISADNYVLAGHARLKAAEKAGLKEVPVIQLPLKGSKALAYMIADNRLQDETDWDFPKLAELFGILDTGELDLEITGFDIKEIENLLTSEKAGLTDDDAVPEPKEAICKAGDLWRLGNHRLLCGDATVEAHVAKLMAGEKADMVWTDPPYGVNYGAKLEKANPMGYRVRNIENDNLSANKLEEFLRSCLRNMAMVSVDGAPIYVACPQGTLLPTSIISFVGSGFDFHWQLVWVKDQLVLSRADYHFRHENILYGWKSGGTHYFTDDRKQDSIFEVPRPKVSEEHPTMKPIDLIEKMLHNSSKINQIILDPFGGSGSTLIACEKLNRKCYMMEIDEHYCDVIIERWQNFTGRKAEKC